MAGRYPGSWLPVPQEERLADVASPLGRLRHDLGKYVSLQLRWLEGRSDPVELRRALVQDLLATRSGPAGTTDVAELWSELRPSLPDDPERALLDEELAALREALPGLRDGTCPDLALPALAARAERVSALCRSWWTRRSR